MERTSYREGLLATSKPSRYVGGEPNQVVKPDAQVELRFGLAFPDVYEIGMSHLGMKILYKVLNDVEWVQAERIFTPWVDRYEYMREHGELLTTMETRREVKSLDILGFSLQYELSFSNVLATLAVAGIPFRAADRDLSWPIVIGGGSNATNPEPVAPFFDAFLIGEGEEAAAEICEVVRRGKAEGWDKPTMLARLEEVQGIYIPAHFEAVYDEETGAIVEMKRLDGSRKRPVRRVVADLEKAPFPTAPVVPLTETVHDRIAIEISRGCTQGCRYCQAGMIFRPQRERSPQTVARLIDESIQNTGLQDASLLSLSVGDYSKLEQLARLAVGACAPSRTSIGLPSLRISTLSKEVLQLIHSIRRTGVTIVPEAGTQRMRDVINKRITEEEILHDAGLAFEAGNDTIKTYFMIGLPGETWDDVAGIVELAKKIREQAAGKGLKRRPEINVSVSTFVPKPHTPFQWSRQISLEESRQKISFLKKHLRKNGLKFRWQNPELSNLEGVFARGDRRLADAIEEAHRLGCIMDGWSEHIRLDLWQQAFENVGLDPAFYVTRERPKREVLPWDHIETRVLREFLYMDYEDALKGDDIEDCFTESCYDCGVCGEDGLDNREAKAAEEVPEGEALQTPAQGDTKIVYRLHFRRWGKMALLSHLEMMHLMQRSLRRIGFPFRYSEGFHPQPKIHFSMPLPTGVESDDERCEIEATKRFAVPKLLDELNAVLPDGLEITEVKLFGDTEQSLMEAFCGARYSVNLGGLLQTGALARDHVEARLDAFRQVDTFPVKKYIPKREKTREVDLKASLKQIDWSDEQTLVMETAFAEGAIANPYKILHHLLEIEESTARAVPVRKMVTLTH